jgi:DinB superfamily
LQRLDAAWVGFKTSYAGLTDAELLEPGVTGKWSVRDLIAHVTWWDAEALTHLPGILEGRRPPRYSTTYGGIDAFNAMMTARKASLSLADVFREQEETHRRLIALIDSTPEEQFASETRFRHRLRLDTYAHYPKHAAAIVRWRQQHGLLRLAL